MKYDIIAVDFDGTIAKDMFPEVGPLIRMAALVLTEYKARGGTIVIWTCRNGQPLEDAKEFLRANNIPFDYVNETPKERIERFRSDPRKIGFDLVIDDKDYYSQYLGYVDWEMVARVLFNDARYRYTYTPDPDGF